MSEEKFDDKTKIDQPIRIRLSNDFTLEDYSPMITQYVNDQADFKLDILYGVLIDPRFKNRPKPTRWQKFKRQIEDYKQRARDICTILTGGDIHKDCGY